MNDNPDNQPSAGFSSLPQVHDGLRIGELSVGADMDEIFHVMAGRGKTSTYQEEYDIFNNFGYVPEKHSQFILGFEEVWHYDEKSSADYPVFKIYFREGLARYVALSSYGTGVYDYDRCRRIKTSRGLAFGDSIEKMEQLYGEDHLKYKFGTYDGDFIYPELGISFVFENNELRNIYLFPAKNIEVIQKLKNAHS
ncbi:MAG: hypothetical protein ACKVTZ_15815 [Bacteroidia bacterium]